MGKLPLSWPVTRGRLLAAAAAVQAANSSPRRRRREVGAQRLAGVWRTCTVRTVSTSPLMACLTSLTTTTRSPAAIRLRALSSCSQGGPEGAGGDFETVRMLVCRQGRSGRGHDLA